MTVCNNDGSVPYKIISVGVCFVSCILLTLILLGSSKECTRINTVDDIYYEKKQRSWVPSKVIVIWIVTTTDDIGMILLSFVFPLYCYTRIMWITIIESMTDFFRPLPPAPSKKEHLFTSVLFNFFFKLLKDDFLLTP